MRVTNCWNTLGKLSRIGIQKESISKTLHVTDDFSTWEVNSTVTWVKYVYLYNKSWRIRLHKLSWGPVHVAHQMLEYQQKWQHRSDRTVLYSYLRQLKLCETDESNWLASSKWLFWSQPKLVYILRDILECMLVQTDVHENEKVANGILKKFVIQ